MAVLGNKIIKSFNDQQFCDVQIKLADESVIGGHKLVLILGSQWFSSRLNGKWSEEMILCQDYPTEITKSMLQFFYTSTIDISIQNVDELYEMSEYYAVTDLANKCLEFLHENVTMEHVFKVLITSHTYHIPDIQEKCLEFIDVHIEELLLEGGESFYEMPLELLITLLKRKSLCIHEEFLFSNVLLWMEGEDAGRGSQIWQQIMPHIIYGRMSLDIFVENVIKKDILDNELSMNIMLFLSVQDRTLPQCYTSPRCCTTGNDIVVSRFLQRSSSSSWVVENAMNGDRISFSINLDNLKLRGVLVFGNNSKKPLTISLFLYSDGGLAGKTKIKQICQDDADIPVIFPKPIVVSRDSMYTIILQMSGELTFFGEFGMSSVRSSLPDGSNLRVTYFDANCGPTDTKKGQIKGIILKNS